MMWHATERTPATMARSILSPDAPDIAWDLLSRRRSRRLHQNCNRRIDARAWSHPLEARQPDVGVAAGLLHTHLTRRLSLASGGSGRPLPTVITLPGLEYRPAVAKRAKFYRDRSQAGSRVTGPTWDASVTSNDVVGGSSHPGQVGAVTQASSLGVSSAGLPRTPEEPPVSGAEHLATFRSVGSRPTPGERLDVVCSCGWHSGRTWPKDRPELAAAEFLVHRSGAGQQ